MLPDPVKVEAITEMPRPREKAEVRRLPGMINYLGKFVLVKFIWSKVHEDAFNKLKEMMNKWCWRRMLAITDLELFCCKMVDQ